MKKILALVVAIISILSISAISVMAGDLPQVTQYILIKNTNSDPILLFKSSAEARLKDVVGTSQDEYARTITSKVRIQNKDGNYMSWVTTSEYQTGLTTPDVVASIKSDSTKQADSQHKIAVWDGVIGIYDYFGWYVAGSTEYKVYNTYWT